MCYCGSMWAFYSSLTARKLFRPCALNERRVRRYTSERKRAVLAILFGQAALKDCSYPFFILYIRVKNKSVAFHIALHIAVAAVGAEYPV